MIGDYSFRASIRATSSARSCTRIYLFESLYRHNQRRVYEEGEGFSKSRDGMVHLLYVAEKGVGQHG